MSGIIMTKQICLILITTSLMALLLVIATYTVATSQVVAQEQVQPIKFSIKNIAIKPTSNTSADVQVAFSAYNPNKGTVMVEEIRLRCVTRWNKNCIRKFRRKIRGLFGVISNHLSHCKRQ